MLIYFRKHKIPYSLILSFNFIELSSLSTVCPSYPLFEHLPAAAAGVSVHHQPPHSAATGSPLFGVPRFICKRARLIPVFKRVVASSYRAEPDRRGMPPISNCPVINWFFVSADTPCSARRYEQMHLVKCCLLDPSTSFLSEISHRANNALCGRDEPLDDKARTVGQRGVRCAL